MFEVAFFFPGGFGSWDVARRVFAIAEAKAPDPPSVAHCANVPPGGTFVDALAAKFL